MAIRIALQHKTVYSYDRPVPFSPHEVRLRPAPHARTPILSYSLRVTPEQHFINWQQDPYGNWVARLVFPEPSSELAFTVDLVADMTVINPFDFFVENYAERYPFAYTEHLAYELAPYLTPEAAGPRFAAWLDAVRHGLRPGIGTADFLVDLNRRAQGDIRYLVRMEPGVQTPDETLERASGSCRDSGWLLVQALRHLGLAARFVSGYLLQLTADVKALDGPSGPDRDFTDLHAWAEVYIPGAGWIGLDPTSGLLAGEGHVPLACSAVPASAAPVTGWVLSDAPGRLHFEMAVTRVHEDPRVTKPYTDADWHAIDALGERVDVDLQGRDVRLTQGGEPTFVSIDDTDGAEWNFTALSPRKRELAGRLARRLLVRFAPGGLLHAGQGKWYPGEPLPRWSLGVFWRADGTPVWRDPELLAVDGTTSRHAPADARAFAMALVRRLGVHQGHVIPAYEDPWAAIRLEEQLPANVDPLAVDLADPAERRRLAGLLARGLGEPAGYVVPLAAREAPGRTRSAAGRWRSSCWPLRRDHLYLVAGDSAMGLRLPLSALPEVDPDDVEPQFARDPFAPRPPLDDPHAGEETFPAAAEPLRNPAPRDVVRTALCVEARGGRLHVFMPPLERVEDYLALLAAVERTAASLRTPITVEGYPPPADPRLRSFAVTPDPGVIEVNVHPAARWRDLVETTVTLYDEARQARLGTEKFMLDGRHTGTGGGNHVTLGGATAADSPWLRRPDVLRSLITYWQNHPALSYLFSGTFIGPTSQAPRVDEARDDNLYELAIAFQQMERALPEAQESDRPWLVDRLLRNLLVDLTGNTHRAEFSIDKLYSPDGPSGRLGLVEFRAFEMPPHWQMSCCQMLLLRALVARFWAEPYRARLIPWGTELHDRWMLPHFVAQDMRDVVGDLRRGGYAFEERWFEPFVEFRFPRYGTVAYEGIELELRQAIEPWHVLGEEVSGIATARYVDSSVERLQVRVRGLTGGRHLVACNRRPVPLTPTGVRGEFVAGIRFRAWAPPSALHPTIGVHAPLTFDVIDTWSERAIGGCTYHVAHPGGRNYEAFPVNANEAEARRVARFWAHGHTPGPMRVAAEPPNPSYPCTLDLRAEP